MDTTLQELGEWLALFFLFVWILVVTSIFKWSRAMETTPATATLPPPPLKLHLVVAQPPHDVFGCLCDTCLFKRTLPLHLGGRFS